MSKNFEDLSTVAFRNLMYPHMIETWKQVFGNNAVTVIDMSNTVMDRELSVDSIVNVRGVSFPIQEKIRNHKYFVDPDFRVIPECPDFTQEILNGNGELGEWSKLYAQLYWFGWANETCTGLTAWCVLDIVKYKQIALEHYDIKGLRGQLRANKKFGKSCFWAIPIVRLKKAVMASSSNMDQYWI